MGGGHRSVDASGSEGRPPGSTERFRPAPSEAGGADLFMVERVDGRRFDDKLTKCS